MKSFVNKQHTTYLYTLHFKNAFVNNLIKGFKFKAVVMKTLNSRS